MIRKLRQGIDFLGYVILPRHVVLRTNTKRRMFKKLFEKQEMMRRGELSKQSFQQSIQSYLGLLRHCDGYQMSQSVKNIF